MKLLAKLITQRREDPAARASFDPETLRPHDYGKKRVGRPRLNWVNCTLQDFWREVKAVMPHASYEGELDLSKDRHVGLVLELAKQYDDRHCFSYGSS